MKKIVSLILAFVLTMFCAGLDARADVIAPELQEIMQSLGPDQEVAVIITLADKVDLKNFKDKDKALRRSKIIRALQQKTEKTQKNIKNYLKQSKVGKVKPFWIFNGLAVTANAKAIKQMAGMAGIESIRPDSILTLEDPPISVNAGVPEWNINAINAPELWSRGYTGTGTVLATMDTGVDVTHPDLAAQWRGGTNSWYDPNGQHATPYDADGHGTNVMGVMVGGDAGGSAIGVAPGAQWIAVKIFDDAGQAFVSDIHAGYQWLLDPDGNPDTDDAPDVVNNSWGFPDQAGTCLLIIEFQNDISVLKAAEIGIVFAAGNHYENESPANYTGSFAVGAVDDTQTIAYFSALGPSACDSSIFPEVMAPGVNVLTSYIGGSYSYVSGTSIAAPHVTGAMGLLLSAYPTLSISKIEVALKEATQDLGAVGPDNTYGYGLLDVLGAYNLLTPLANNDIFTIPRNTTAIIAIADLLANDVARGSPIDVNSLALRAAVSARGNIITVNADNTITYTPEGGGGPDYFWYTINDTAGATSNEATVRINRVRAAQPAPSSAVAPAPGREPIIRQ
jgi:serine protease AprX